MSSRPVADIRSCRIVSTLVVGDPMDNNSGEDPAVRRIADDPMAAEVARDKAEELRRRAEQAREVRDQHREALETIRQERERLRDGAETARFASEEARIAAETARTASEEARVATDAARQAVVEAVRATADTLNVAGTDEGCRGTAEDSSRDGGREQPRYQLSRPPRTSIPAARHVYARAIRHA